LTLELRRLREGVVVVRASNDVLFDDHGTAITVEALLRDWWAGYSQHRSVSLQHNLPELRGIGGKPMVGRATRVDFTPQLEVKIVVNDLETRRLIDEGKITGASLEFVQLSAREQKLGGETGEVLYRLSSEPEFCGLSLVDIGSVPASDILTVRSTAADWQYAVIDPALLADPTLDPTGLRWFDHHDPLTHMVDEAKLARVVTETSSSFAISPRATLSREEIVRRANAHIKRHTEHGIAMRTTAQGETMNQWIKLRAAQLVASGQAESVALTAAKAEWEAMPVQQRTAIEAAQTQPAQPTTPAADPVEARNAHSIEINLNGLGEQPQTRAAAPVAPVAPAAVAQPSARERWLQARAGQLEAEGQTAAAATAAAATELEQNPELTERLDNAGREVSVEERAATAAARAVTQVLSQQAESPMAALVNGGAIARRAVDRDELLAGIMIRTIIPQINQMNGQGDGVTAQMRQEVDNLLRRAGLDSRALTVTNQATVIRNELATFFTQKPVNEVIGRNHWAGLPMGNAKKVDFPTFDQNTLSFEYNDNDGGSITDSDPTNDKFPIEVTDVKGAVTVGDSFLDFNAAGLAYTQDYLIPGLRSALQINEDGKFFLGNWTSGRADPSTFKGLRSVSGVTAVAAGTNGDAFTLKIMISLLRALPARYLNDRRRLAFYLPSPLGWDFGEIIADRKTALGDRFLEQFFNQPGPTPIGQFDGVPVYTKDLPVNETQGSNSDAGTIYLAHRDALAVNSDPMLKLEPYRQAGFRTRLQIMSYTGLGYRFVDAIVRRVGVRPAQ
jgi:hypothetical protein